MKFAKSVKTLLAITLSLALLLVSLFTVSAAEQEPVVNTKISSAPHTEIYSTTSFTQADFDENFTKWSNGGASIANGVLSVPAGGNSRDTAYMNKTSSLNQYVKASFATDGTTQCYDYIWLRVGSFHRTQYNDDVPIGYIVKTNRNKNICSITLEKAYVNDDGNYAISQIGTKMAGIDSYSSYSNDYLDYSVEANATYDEVAQTTVISIRMYKSVNLMNSVSFEDSESELQVAGKVGLACAGWNGADSSKKMNCTSFSYHTTDNNVDKCVFNAVAFDAKKFNQFTTINNNANASVENGQLNVAAGNGNSRNSAHFLKEQFTEYTLSTVIANPHSSESKPISNPMVWLKANTVVRPGGEVAPYGYLLFVKWNNSDNNALIQLRKQALNSTGDNIVGEAVVGNQDLTIDTLSSDGVTFMDLKAVATIICNPNTGINTVSVRLYKGTYSADGWVITYTDTDSTLSGKGMIGLSANEAAASYKTLKVLAKENVLPAYIEENTAKADGTMVGQEIWLDKSTTYQFSALTSDNEAMEPLAIKYRTSSGGTMIEITDSTADAVKGTYYNKYTYTFNTSDFTNVVADDAGRIAVFLGYSQKDSNANNVKYTDFELRKVMDGTVGGNFLSNGDFKMGSVGWNNDLKDAWIVAFSGTSGDSTLFGVADAIRFGDNNRETLYRETNLANYMKNFAVSNYEDYLGDVNEDGAIDVIDLIRNKKNIINNVYAFYGDMNLDGEISANDLVLVRKVILNSKK